MAAQLAAAVQAAYFPGAHNAAALQWLQAFQSSPEAWQVHLPAQHQKSLRSPHGESKLTLFRASIPTPHKDDKRVK